MFDCITSDPAVLSGKPTIRGTRISVSMILEWMASGATRDAILTKHPHLTELDIEEALNYSTQSFSGDILFKV